MRRNVCIKLLFGINVCILLYLAFHVVGRNDKKIAPSDDSNVDKGKEDNPEKNFLRQIFNVVQSSLNQTRSSVTSAKSVPEDNAEVVDLALQEEDEKVETPEVIEDPHDITVPQPAPTTSSSTATSSTSTSSQLVSNQAFQCHEKSVEPRIDQRSGNYWILYNYIRAEKTFLCNETITYTTHGEYTFLHNLEPLLERWQGPVSIGIYAPGEDFLAAIQASLYYRECLNSSLVRDYVTFHFFFPYAHMPNGSIMSQESLAELVPDCSNKPAIIEEKPITYRSQKSLDYPVNVGRNIARESANSHFIFPSDIELYPSPGLIPDFLDMIRRNEGFLERKNPRVFVNSIFEIKENTELPKTKAELVELLKKKIVIPFHKKVCSECHSIPKAKEWAETPADDKMNVFHFAKRTPPYSHWEPIYIGTNDDPFYDERLSWEGRSDKMTQGYQLCVLDYDFMILNNAFLIHRPGIKSKADSLNQTQKKKVATQNSLISKTIMPELRKIYGQRKGCVK